MENFICKTCGVQFEESYTPPESCPICLDPRQYVGWNGQEWTTSDELKELGYKNELRAEEPGLLGIGLEPSFSIGQRALLVQNPGGNVLFDCVSILDQATKEAIDQIGGIKFICFSHPHFYDSMIEWSRAFDNAEVIVPLSDKAHVMRQDNVINYWDGSDLELVPGITLIQTGGHFEGS